MSDRGKIPASMRRKIEDAIEKLIAALDAIDPDHDLEEENEHGDGTFDGHGGDDEPSLGATNVIDEGHAWASPEVIGIDLEFDGDTSPSADSEPLLGSLDRHINQTNWTRGNRFCVDAEQEHDGREPDDAV